MTKKVIYFLSLYPPDTAPSTRFRYEQFFPLLIENGFNPIIWSFFRNEKALKSKGVSLFLEIIMSYLKLLTRLVFLEKRVTVFVHRETNPFGPAFFEYLLSKWKKCHLIYDFDDAIWLYGQDAQHPLKTWLRNPNKTKVILSLASKVSVGNAYLAEYAAQFNPKVTLLPTVVDTENRYTLTPSIAKKEDQYIRIGWTGSTTTLKHLHLLNHVLKKIKITEPSIKIVVICDTEPTWLTQDIEFIKWNPETEIIDISRVDIGLMPLPDDNWSKGKCGFKAIQFMALGIPVCASPVGVNPEVVLHGINGFLCDSDDEWLRYVLLLAQNEVLREEMGKKAREHIESRYSLRSLNGRYLSLFKS